MPPCPSDDKLTLLLADKLAAVDQESVARHVETCASCQGRLARLTSMPDTEKWQRAGDSLHGSIAEEEVLRRLKHLPESNAAGSRISAGRTRVTGGPAVASVRPIVPGYEILGELGRGGMGIVYRARQLALQRTVALKMVLSGAHAGVKDLARFRAEAEVIARLQHPNIVQIHDVGEVDGRPFFALEYVSGGSLAQYLQGTPQAARPSAQLVETLARAVHAAHGNGVIHRDLKPANILLADTGAASGTRDATHQSPLTLLQPKITDFGVAKCSDSDWQATSGRGQTTTGELLGTPNYMAPEQATTPRRPIGPPADIYALGAILYEMLTGRPPFTGESPLDTLLQVLHSEPISVTRLQPSVAKDLETICLKCLHKEPGRRYGSALELADDLRRFLDGQPILARPPSRLYVWGKFARRHKIEVAAGVGILLTLIAGAVVASLFAVRENRERGRAEENARHAETERDEAIRQNAYAHMAAAGAALRDDDVAAAARHLEIVPTELRDWEWRYFHSSLDESAGVVRSPKNGLMLVTSSKQGLYYIALDPDLVRVIGVDGKVAHTMPQEIANARFLEATSRGVQIFGEDRAGWTTVWDENGKVRQRLNPPEGCFPGAMSVNRAQTLLAVACGQDGPPYYILLYDLTTGAERARCIGHSGFVWSVALSPDAKRLASGSEDNTIRIWDTTSGTQLHLLEGHRDKVYSVAFSPDGARIVSASGDGTVRQWDAISGRPIGLPYRGHRHEIRTAVYSPDGDSIASADAEGTVRLWQVDDQADIAVYHGHMSNVFQLAFTADGRRLASVGDDHTGRVWDIAPSPAVLRGHNNYVYPVAYSHDGQWLASGGWDGTVRLWDAQSGAAGAVLPHSSRVRALAFSPDDTWLVSGCDDEDHLTIWDLVTGRRRTTIPSPGNRLYAVAVSPDGGRIAAVDKAGTMQIRDAVSGAEMASARLPEPYLRGTLTYSPDGRWLAMAAEDFTIGLWDTQRNEFAARWRGHSKSINSLAFSPDGRQLASTSDDHTVRLWDTKTGEASAVLSGHTDEVFTAVFHPDGKRLASGGRDRVILLWDVDSGAEVARLHGHRNYVFTLAFSPDGSTLASASGDFTVRLRDTEPLARRLQARREAQAQREEADRLADQLLKQELSPSQLHRALWIESSLSNSLRREVQRAVWKRLATKE